MTNEEARNILLTSVHPQTSEEAEAIGIAVRAIPVKPIRYDWASMTPPYVCRGCREDSKKQKSRDSERIFGWQG